VRAISRQERCAPRATPTDLTTLAIVIPSITNTSGELEREARSRRSNVLEALGLATVVFLVLWPFCFGWGVLGDSKAVRQLAHLPLALGFAWVILVSPFWHRDTLESLGLGNPVRLWRMLRERTGWRRARLMLAVGLLFNAMFLVGIANWPDTAKLFKLGSAARLWIVTPEGQVKAIIFCVLISIFVVTCLVRYDNFPSAFRVALTVSAALMLLAGTAALLHRGPAAFAAINPSQYPLDVFAYVFWGGLQQYFFTAYFATRLRKGFAPSVRSDNAIATERRRSAVILGGIACSVLLAPSLWLTVRGLYGADQAPIGMLFWFAIFAFPAGAAWTHFFCRDKKRMLVATLSGSFFGLIHIDSYGLVLVTFALGTILAWVFMEDRYRNLSALGFIHGFLGSTFGKLFKGHSAGVLRVDYRVGPWNVDEPTAAVLIIPTLCLIAYAALLIWAMRRVAPGQALTNP
jgi:hypothetical protein